MKPRERARKSDATDRMEGFVRLAKRTRGGKRHEPNTTDRATVAKELGISVGTLRSWLSRFPEEWKQARVMAGLDAPVAVVATVETDGSASTGSADLGRHPPGLTLQQAEACRCRVLHSMTLRETGAQVNAHPDTVCAWQNAPAWQVYADSLAQQRHRATLEAHQQTAARGGQIRLRLLAQAEAWLDGIEKLAQEAQKLGAPFLVDTDALARVAGLLDRLTTSAEDRAGYPRTERREVDVSVPSPVTTLPDDELARRRMDVESRLRLLEGGCA